MPKTALMCPLTFFDVREPKNPYMGLPIDPAKAERQRENLRRALQDAELKVEIIDPVEDLDDMVFAANQVFVGQHERLGNFIVPSRMRYASWRKEVTFLVDESTYSWKQLICQPGRATAAETDRILSRIFCTGNHS
jgi:N-dimethylarginine dimethylaminohydrolase